MDKLALTAVASAIACCGSASYGAEETATSLDTVVVNADRQQTPRNESASPVRVVTRTQIESLPVKDVTEALAGLPNVNIRRSGGPDGEPSVGLYGISAQPRSSSSTTLAIDGVPLNNGMFPEASLNVLPMSLVERVELVQGPASAAYGNNAKLGVVNLVTRRPSQFGGEAYGSVARWNTNEVGGSIGGGFGGGGRYLLGYDRRRTDGHLQPSDRADFSNSALQNVAAFADKAFGALILSAAYVRYEWDRTNPSYLVQPGTPAASNPVGTPSATFENGRREHLHVGAAYQFTPAFSGELVYTHNTFDEQTRFNAAYGTPSGFGSTNPTDQATVSNGLIAKGTWETARNLLTFGFERQLGELEDRVTGARTRGQTNGWFVQDRYRAFDNQLVLSAGYRYDKFSFYDEASSSPKLGFVWKPAGLPWLVRGNVARAFSAPSFNQLFGSFGNPKLVATTFDLQELGVEFRPAQNATIGATIFATSTTNPIFPRPRNQNPICAPGAGNCFVNVPGDLKTRGMTLDFRWAPTRAWTLGGSYTYLDPEENTFATSANVFKLDTTYRSGPWTASATLRRETGRYFQDNHASPFPNFTVIDAALRYRANKSLTLSLIVENLTNETYATTQIVSTNAAFPALPIMRPERYATLRADYRF